MTPANTQTARIAVADFSSRAIRLGTRKIPPPITMPITIASASIKPSLRGRFEGSLAAISIFASSSRHYTPSFSRRSAALASGFRVVPGTSPGCAWITSYSKQQLVKLALMVGAVQAARALRILELLQVTPSDQDYVIVFQSFL